MTDITAAVIDEIPGMGIAMVGFLAPGHHVGGDVSATTQESPGERRRLDLVLRDEKALEVWVEVKDWADESGDQLKTYNRLRRTGDRASVPVLVYLTRIGTHSASAPDVQTFRWQEVAGQLRDWASASPRLEAAHRWLLGTI